MATVELERVDKIFPDGFHAVRDVSLSIEDGEFMVLVGPSGCAKSTTLNMIAGLEDVTSGRVRIGGRDVTHLPPKDRDVAMVFQSYALYPHMSVRQNMAFGLKLRRMDKAEIQDRVNEAARILSIEELLERRPRELSGGQRQRVALGRAIVRKPQVFLFDEPLSNLDAKLRAQMRVELAALHRKLGATVVYVTHDQTEAMTLGQRITVLDRGVVQQVAEPLAVYARPANRFTAQFIGSPSMNMLPVRLETMEDGLVIRLAPNAGEEGGALLLPPDKSRILLSRSGQDVLFGIRPEHVTPVEESEPEREGSTFSVRVDLVERMGNEAFAHVTCAGERVVCEVAPDAALEPGSMLTVRFAMEHAHVFEPESGLNVSLESEEP